MAPTYRCHADGHLYGPRKNIQIVKQLPAQVIANHKKVPMNTTAELLII